MVQLSFLDEKQSGGVSSKVHQNESSLTFAASVSTQLATGECVLVKPSIHIPIRWNLEDFREIFGLHSSSIVKVQSQSISHSCSVSVSQMGNSALGRDPPRIQLPPVFRGLPAEFLGGRRPSCTRYGNAQIHRVSGREKKKKKVSPQNKPFVVISTMDTISDGAVK